MREDVQGTRCRVCAGTIAADGTLWVHVDGVSRVHRAEPAPCAGCECAYGAWRHRQSSVDT